jgi:hypothetical protein
MDRHKELLLIYQRTLSIEENLKGVADLTGLPVKLPKLFQLDTCLRFLKSIENGDVEGCRFTLESMFIWGDSHQGYEYWSFVFEGLPKIKAESLTQIKLWAVCSELNHQKHTLRRLTEK